jgi:hypothetical protein
MKASFDLLTVRYVPLFVSPIKASSSPHSSHEIAFSWREGANIFPIAIPPSLWKRKKFRVQQEEGGIKTCPGIGHYMHG